MRHHLKQIALAGLLACLGSSALAASYFFIQPKSNEMSKSSPLSLALSSSVLPEAVVGMPYNSGAGFDLKSLVVVTGDSSFNAALTEFDISSGALPAGLTIGSTGSISGTPTVTGNATFQLRAAYKTETGSKAYAINVAAGSTITVTRATYGFNVSDSNNRGVNLASLCNSTVSCTFDPYQWGDPHSGVAKSFSMTYTCTGTGTKTYFWPAESGGRTHTVSCP